MRTTTTDQTDVLADSQSHNFRCVYSSGYATDDAQSKSRPGTTGSLESNRVSIKDLFKVANETTAAALNSNLWHAALCDDAVPNAALKKKVELFTIKSIAAYARIVRALAILGTHKHSKNNEFTNF